MSFNRSECSCMIKITEDEYFKAGEKRFGPNRREWVFTCPLCKVSTKAQEWLDHDAEGMIAFSCIGRVRGSDQGLFTDPIKAIGCNYAGGGLFLLNPVFIIDSDPDEILARLFDFAVDPLVKPNE